ncbi:hypothetical protein BDP27DRAFT_407437 [Rhodocollybia butyracea]|uniref:Uncharacterized protein n=1 Tax=Rhodocollybia butyracea TaxID=206335 RepID=A0A9P5U0K6_9AGAR|nr:hypothetical protein BDP27DRAFT_407437 [Rhodocollybia butyracea]
MITNVERHTDPGSARTYGLVLHNPHPKFTCCLKHRRCWEIRWYQQHPITRNRNFPLSDCILAPLSTSHVPHLHDIHRFTSRDRRDELEHRKEMRMSCLAWAAVFAMTNNRQLYSLETENRSTATTQSTQLRPYPSCPLQTGMSLPEALESSQLQICKS